MATRQPFAINEWYHCFNRGVDKRKIFQSKSDYERFLMLMYLGNGSSSTHISNLKQRALLGILNDDSLERGAPLVEIGAYSLMPNHFHFILREIQDEGIARFMQKLGTGYTMYFNKKFERTGALLAGTFKSKHVADDRYMQWLIGYVHFNAVELFESHWKEGRGDLRRIEKQLAQFPYSSLCDFLSPDRPEKKLLGDSLFKLFNTTPTLQTMLEDAQAYYRQYQG